MKQKIKTLKQLPNLFEEEERKELLRASCEHFYFVWDDVEFDKNILRIKTTRHKKIFKPLPLKGSLSILNDIKKEYFDRLYHKPFKLYFLNNEFQPDLSKDWQRITRLIEAGIEYAEFRINRVEGKHKFGHFKKLQPQQIIELFKERFSKTVYLKYLAARQSELYKIIPILEYQNKQWEESFIFRLKTGSERILIVWENAKEGRATYLFIADDETMDDRLNAIESFIRTSIDLKRTLLHDHNREAKKIKRELMHIDSINHETIESFKSELQHILNRY